MWNFLFSSTENTNLSLHNELLCFKIFLSMFAVKMHINRQQYNISIHSGTKTQLIKPCSWSFVTWNYNVFMIIFYNMYNSMSKCVRELCKNNVSLVTMHWIKLQINAPEWRDTIPWFGKNQKENPLM